jgi:hypothetical protein
MGNREKKEGSHMAKAKKMLFLVSTIWLASMAPARAQTEWIEFREADNFRGCVDVAVGGGRGWGVTVRGELVEQYNPGRTVSVGSKAVRIGVDPGGLPWVVNDKGEIFRSSGAPPFSLSWTQMPGAASDIGIGSDGTVWVIGAGGALFRWDQTTGGWVRLPTGGGVRITVDGGGNPWVVNTFNEIWQHTGSAWNRFPGTAVDLSIGRGAFLGLPYILGKDGQVYRWNESTKTWVLHPVNTFLCDAPLDCRLEAVTAIKAFAARGSGRLLLAVD